MIRGRRDMRKAQYQHRRRQQQQASHAEQDSHPLISRPPPSQAANNIARAPETSRGDESLPFRSEEHTSELQSLMRISYAVFCLNKKKQKQPHQRYNNRSSQHVDKVTTKYNTHSNAYINNMKN